MSLTGFHKLLSKTLQDGLIDEIGTISKWIDDNHLDKSLIRFALTGKFSGLDLYDVISLLGVESCKERLSNFLKIVDTSTT